MLRAAREEPRLDGPTNVAIASAVRAGIRLAVARTRPVRDRLGAGHIVQADRPDLVIAAAGELVQAARRAGFALPSVTGKDVGRPSFCSSRVS